MQLQHKGNLRIDKDLNDEGAISLAVALIFASGFFVLVFALVFDVGTLYSERRVVQNAADLSAQALAIECAETSGVVNSTCEQSTKNSAETFVRNYANLNSPDLLSTANLCGRGTFGLCPPQDSHPFKCGVVNTNLYPNWIRVMSDSKTQTSDYIVPAFSSLVDPNIKADVKGCANAAWGKSAFAPVVLPIGLPICDYRRNGATTIASFLSNSPTQSCSVTDLNGQTWNYAAATKGFATFATYRDLNGTDLAIGCPNASAGIRLEVGFRLNYLSSLSQVYQQTCGTKDNFLSRMNSIVDSGQRIFIPALSDVICSNGTNTNCIGSYSFKIEGFYAFQVKAYRFSSQDSYPITFSWDSPCTGSTQCIFGEFSRAVVPGAEISTTPGPSVGAQAVQLLP